MKVSKQDTPEKREEIVVFSILRTATCAECGTELMKGDFLKVENEKPLCMECADLGHLVFLPSGNTALTSRSRKNSTLSAVVVRFSRARGRYERRGLLIEEAALEKAEAECLGDEEQRLRARARAAALRERADEKYVSEFAERILAQFPGCPADEATRIARHACQKHSGRIGRTAAAKEFDAEAIDLAVMAHVRHVHTRYAELLTRGWDRFDARAAVADRVAGTMDHWRRKA